MSNTVMMRVPVEAKNTLKAVASEMGMTTQELFLEMVAEVENRFFFKKMALAYKDLSEDADAIAAEKKVLDTLDAASGDGLAEAMHEHEVQAR